MVVTDALEMGAVERTSGWRRPPCSRSPPGADALCLGHDIDEVARRLGCARRSSPPCGAAGSGEERLAEAAGRVAASHAPAATRRRRTARSARSGSPQRGARCACARATSRGDGPRARRRARRAPPRSRRARRPRSHRDHARARRRRRSGCSSRRAISPQRVAAVRGAPRSPCRCVVVRDVDSHPWQRSGRRRSRRRRTTGRRGRRRRLPEHAQPGLRRAA